MPSVCPRWPVPRGQRATGEEAARVLGAQPRSPERFVRTGPRSGSESRGRRGTLLVAEAEDVADLVAHDAFGGEVRRERVPVGVRVEVVVIDHERPRDTPAPARGERAGAPRAPRTDGEGDRGVAPRAVRVLRGVLPSHLDGDHLDVAGAADALVRDLDQAPRQASGEHRLERRSKSGWLCEIVRRPARAGSRWTGTWSWPSAWRRGSSDASADGQAALIVGVCWR